MKEINPQLLDVASWRATGEQEKKAFVPPGADPAAAGGMPPGAPPAAPPPGGAPPMDPMAAAGGAPPAPLPPVDPSMAGMAPPAVPGAPGAPGAGGSKKIDPAFVYMELSRCRKLLTGLYNHLGIDMPPDILEDQSVAQVIAGQQPQSQPIGQEQQPDPNAGGLPGIGQSPAINPLQPPGGGGGGEAKIASVKDLLSRPPDKRLHVGSEVAHQPIDKTSAMADTLAALARSLNSHQPAA